MKIHQLAMVVILGIMIVAGLSCDEGSAESAGGTPISTPSPTIPASPVGTITPSPTAEPTPPPTPMPTITPSPTATVTPETTPIPTPTLVPTPTIIPTGTPLPTQETGSCVSDRDGIQVALDAYHAQNGDWPTTDGQSGDIEWGKLIPDLLDGVPHTDSSCEWQVDDDPEGSVCLLTPC